MISSIIDAVLLTALAATSGSVLLMYRRLRRFDVLQSEAARAFATSAHALDNAKAALETLQDDGGEMAVSLAARLNEARLMINEIERTTMRHRPDDTPAAPDAPEYSPSRIIDSAWEDRFEGLLRQAERHSARTAHDYRSQMPVPRPPAPEPVSPVAAAIEAALARMSPSDAAAAARNPRWRALADAAHRAA
ncbi:hypothetical protein RDV64_17265 [Acuticoccus sp. MNP-M23]|uniref:hypothetical protein n=1 Tax=Acuticoccus sp. MNP-M23 TaxID=3072793 RepID=UPI002814D3E1|nr:hypothetical protein [Acuticoccus sp. MNP-M23]WMS41802.1 hypothetical protein RDV64_17265 [Acuticoccus sp. MNP-M23]